MAYIVRSLLGAGLVVGLLYVVIYGSSELSGEVITLRTFHPDGLATATSLWIVDDGARSYIRSGTPDSKWLARIETDSNVEIVRAGVTQAYRAVLVPKRRERVNGLMAEKYGWADSMMGWMRDPTETVAIRLDRDL